MKPSSESRCVGDVGACSAFFAVTLGLIVRDAAVMEPNPGDVAVTAALLAVPLLPDLCPRHPGRERRAEGDDSPPFAAAGSHLALDAALVLIFAAFMSLFALDVFGQGDEPEETTVRADDAPHPDGAAARRAAGGLALAVDRRRSLSACGALRAAVWRRLGISGRSTCSSSARRR